MKNFDELYNELALKVSQAHPESSTVRALDRGMHFLGKKVIEEAGEVWLAAEYQSEDELAEEISQLLYWLQTVMIKKGISPEQVYKFL